MQKCNAILLQATTCVNTQTSENCHRQKKTYRKSAGSFSFTALEIFAIIFYIMACDDHIRSCVKLLLVCAFLCASRASADRTKTLDFDVKPGGVVHTFSGKIVS